MTGAEFKAARERLGLTYSELGAILGGIRADTIRRKWEIDKPGPSPMACQAVRWMLGGYRPPEWPDRLGGHAGGKEWTRAELQDALQEARLACKSSSHWGAIRFCEVLLARLYLRRHEIIRGPE